MAEIDHDAALRVMRALLQAFKDDKMKVHGPKIRAALASKDKP